MPLPSHVVQPTRWGLEDCYFAILETCVKRSHELNLNIIGRIRVVEVLGLQLHYFQVVNAAFIG